MSEENKVKPVYETPQVIMLGQLAKGEGLEMGTCVGGSNAASGCFNGSLAGDMMEGYCGTGSTIIYG